MIVRFEDQDWQFALDDIDLRDAIYIQNQTGMTLNDVRKGFMESNPQALLAMYWFMMKQNGKTVDMHKVNFKALKFDAALTEAMIEEQKAANPTEESPADPAPETKSE